MLLVKLAVFPNHFPNFACPFVLILREADLALAAASPTTVPDEAEESTFRGSTVTSRALHHARFHYSFKIVLMTVPKVSPFGYWLPGSRTFVRCRIHRASRGKQPAGGVPPLSIEGQLYAL